MDKGISMGNGIQMEKMHNGRCIALDDGKSKMGMLDMAYRHLGLDGPNTRWVLANAGGGVSSWGLRPEGWRSLFAMCAKC